MSIETLAKLDSTASSTLFSFDLFTTNSSLTTQSSSLSDSSSSFISNSNTNSKIKSNSKPKETSEILKRTRSGRCVKFNSDYTLKYANKQQRQNLISLVKKVMNKNENDRTKDDNDLLTNCKDLVEHVDLCKKNRIAAQSHQEIIVDDDDVLEEKCQKLAEAIINSNNCVVYTGAGISTSANIPDYRGPTGLWTMLERGVKIDLPDFALVQPTYSHMVLNALMKYDIVKYIVSQNCDGLHLRSGIDRSRLSELHGNCFIEFCPECYEEYVRLFDVTEQSAFRKHSTGRYCKYCKKTNQTNNYDNDLHSNDSFLNKSDKFEQSYKSKPGSSKFQLRDSIIHFGEKLRNGSPYNWESARDNVKQADLILCLGTSLKVLKHYACLWPKKKSTQIYIVNIQWTPKDKQAKLKINGYCDQVLKLVMNHLLEHYGSIKINEYSFKNDPIFKIAVKLTEDEINTTSKCLLTNNSISKTKTLKNQSNIAKSQSIDSNSKENKLIKKEKDENEANEDNQSKKNSNSWYTKSFKARKIQSNTNKTKNFYNDIKIKPSDDPIDGEDDEIIKNTNINANPSKKLNQDGNEIK